MAGRRRSTRRHRREPIRRRPLVREIAAEGPEVAQVAETVPRPAPLLDLASLRRDLATSLVLGFTMFVAVLVVALVV
jgi:hypothetical protein